MSIGLHHLRQGLRSVAHPTNQARRGIECEETISSLAEVQTRPGQVKAAVVRISNRSVFVGRIFNPSLSAGRIGNPSYSRRRNVLPQRFAVARFQTGDAITARGADVASVTSGPRDGMRQTA